MAGLARRLKAIAMRSPSARWALRTLRARFFQGSKDYWERRYRGGGDAGVGSSGRLAEHKAAVVNALVAEKGVHSVMELGCGDGAQIALLDVPHYVGLDVSTAALEKCQRRFRGDRRKSFELYDPEAFASQTTRARADMTLSLDVIYHLVEDQVFDRYMTHLFDAARKHVVIYSSNHDEETATPHVKHRRFTAWIEQHRPDWRQTRHLANPFPLDPNAGQPTSPAEFYVFERSDAVG